MRDEIGRSNLRGTVGLSTRGRNTADAQFYINMVDNPRLDADYTVFASVMPADMPVVDRIQEGDAMRLSMAKCSPSR
jgi:cyclophilin family peptidyl-prolyl cis-trans isomerase